MKTRHKVDIGASIATAVALGISGSFGILIGGSYLLGRIGLMKAFNKIAKSRGYDNWDNLVKKNQETKSQGN